MDGVVTAALLAGFLYFTYVCRRSPLNMAESAGLVVCLESNRIEVIRDESVVFCSFFVLIGGRGPLVLEVLLWG